MAQTSPPSAGPPHPVYQAGPAPPCPHCGAANHGQGAFCVHCGLALPGLRKPPRIIHDAAYATTLVGVQVQSNLMHRKARTAAVTLLVLGILQLLAAGLFFAIATTGTVPSQLAAMGNPMVTAAIVAGVALGYFALAYWARTSPLPAATIGLVMFISIIALDALADPTSLVRGIIIKVAVIIFLVRAVSAGIKHRELQRLAAAAVVPA